MAACMFDLLLKIICPCSFETSRIFYKLKYYRAGSARGLNNNVRKNLVPLTIIDTETFRLCMSYLLHSIAYLLLLMITLLFPL